MGHKDRTLLSTNPHLMLDGAEYLASMIGAHARRRVRVAQRSAPSCTTSDARCTNATRRRGVRVRPAHAAVALRRRRGVRARALVERQRDDAAVSTEATGRLARRSRARAGRERRDQRAGRAHRSLRRGVVPRDRHADRVPGAPWSRSPAPSTHPTVHEVPLGMPLRTILRNAGADADPQAVLTGGYGGVWLSARAPGRRLLRRGAPSARRARSAPASSSSCRRTRADWPRRIAWCGGWPMRVRASAARAPSDCRRWPRTSHALVARIARRVGGTDATARALRRHRRSRGLSPPRRRRATGRVGVEGLRRPTSRTTCNGTPCVASTSRKHWVAVPEIEHESELVWE